jgi:hypothetical protein
LTLIGVKASAPIPAPPSPQEGFVMSTSPQRRRDIWSRLGPLVLAWGLAALGLLPPDAAAIPAFNRQTGQNCVACHAGGQFPELTPYGRLFKMTGYTIGERTVPISGMVVATYSKVANTSKSDDPGADFQKNGDAILATASLLAGGKLTDNIGGFVQVTYDPYAAQDANGGFHGHSNADNIDLRYADRFISPDRDLIVGISVNNNPSVSDPWNTAPAWMQYVPVPSPTSSRFIDGNAPYPGYGAGGNIAGITGYAYWNRSVYVELGGYTTANGLASLMSAGIADADTTKLHGVNPYWRIAYNHEWGAHSLMVGTSGMVARVFDDPLNPSDSATLHKFTDLGVDAQYQYLLDPHAITAQAAWMRNRHSYPAALANQPAPFFDATGAATLANTNAEDVNNVFRAKLSYVYQARYGGSIAFFNLTGSTNTANQTAGFDQTGTLVRNEGAGSNLSGNPATRGWTLEAFWTPIQYLRIGAQYTMYSRFNGASSNYDGFGRNAHDNNTLFLYTWLAY